MLYAPALALSAVTGLHFEGAVIGIGDNMMNSVIIMSIYVELNEKPAFEKDSSSHSICFDDNDDNDDDSEFAKCF